MFSKVWAVNLFLVFAVIFLIVGSFDVWKVDPQINSKPKGIQTVEVKKNVNINPVPRKYSVSAFDVIVDKNLFSPEREAYFQEEPKSDIETELKSVPLANRKISLYGIMLIGEKKRALILDPAKSSKKQKIWIELGDTFSGLKVEAIHSDRILLREGPNLYTVLLYDEKKKKPNLHSEKQNNEGNPTVVMTENKETEKIEPVQKETNPDSEFEIIKTPFGDIKRRKK